MNLQPRDDDPDSARILTQPALTAAALYQIERWPSCALPHPDCATAVCGVAIDGNIGEFWMVTGKGFAKSAHRVLRRQRQLLNIVVRDFGLEQLLMLVSPGRPKAVRWAERIGFKFSKVVPHMDGQLESHLYIYNQAQGGVKA